MTNNTRSEIFDNLYDIGFTRELFSNVSKQLSEDIWVKQGHDSKDDIGPRGLLARMALDVFEGIVSQDTGISAKLGGRVALPEGEDLHKTISGAALIQLSVVVGDLINSLLASFPKNPEDESHSLWKVLATCLAMSRAANTMSSDMVVEAMRRCTGTKLNYGDIIRLLRTVNAAYIMVVKESLRDVVVVENKIEEETKFH